MKKTTKLALLIVGCFLATVGLGGMIFYAVASTTDMFPFFISQMVYVPVLAMLCIVTGAVILIIVGTERKRQSEKKFVRMQNESLKKIQTQLFQVCPYCGTPVDQTSSFCKICGEKITPTVCPKCGHSNTSDSNYCKYCGEKLKKKKL